MSVYTVTPTLAVNTSNVNTDNVLLTVPAGRIYIVRTLIATPNSGTLATHQILFRISGRTLWARRGLSDFQSVELDARVRLPAGTVLHGRLRDSAGAPAAITVTWTVTVYDFEA